MRLNTISLFAVVILSPFVLSAQSPAEKMTTSQPSETTAKHDERMAWWRQAKFGMFVHWGLYAIPSDGEWHMRQHHQTIEDYSKFAAQFNPTAFNADTWLSIAHDAGMHYIVVTSKHHDGFAMFHSMASPYNVFDATPFHRDPIAELADAAPKHNIRMGVYYSATADWGHPGGGAGEPHWDKAQDGSYDEYIKNVATPQVKELLSNYGPISELWFDNDGTQGMNAACAHAIGEVLKLQPNVIVDPRLQGVPGDFQTVEGHLAVYPPKTDWEYCTTVNGSWGYTHSPAKPIDKLLPDLLTAWSMGGNVLLNVGPDATGTIPPDSVERLHQIGDWLKANGEAIYGSTAGPFEWLPWGQATRKGTQLYLHVWKWPANGVLRVPLPNKVTAASLLTNPKHTPLTMTREGSTLLIKVPGIAPDPTVSVIQLTVEGEPTRYISLTRDRPVTVTSDPKDASNIVDDSTRDWRTTETTGTIEIDLGKPVAFNRLRFSSTYSKIHHVVFEVRTGDTWQTLDEVSDPRGIPAIYEKDLPVTTATHIRARILEADGGLRVQDFSLYSAF